MKYNAKKMNDGNFAVFTGKQYFTDTVTDDREVAEVKALEMTAQWHQEQIDKCRAEWERKLIAKGGMDTTPLAKRLNYTDPDFGDVLC